MRDVDGALKWLRGQSNNPTQSWNNLCQSLSRQSYSMPPYGQSARIAWFNISSRFKHEFRYDDKEAWAGIPAGAIIYSIGPNSSSAGHAWVCNEPGQSAWSNDYQRPGKVDEVDIKVRNWSNIYKNTVGWVDGTQWYADNSGFFEGLSTGLWDGKVPPYENLAAADVDRTLANAAVWRLSCALADLGHGAKGWQPVKYFQTWPVKAMESFNEKYVDMPDKTVLGPKGYEKIFGIAP